MANHEVWLDKILKFPSQIWSDKGYNCGYGNWYEWARNMAFPFGECHILHEGHEALANLIINKLQNETVSNR